MPPYQPIERTCSGVLSACAWRSCRMLGTTMLPQADAASKRRAAVIAVAFAIAWPLILISGSDHPPPINFLWILPFIFVGALLVYWRATVYSVWKSQLRPRRASRATTEGVVAGLVLAILLRAAPWSGEPSISVSTTAVFIWLAVLGTLGGVNALIVYALAARQSQTKRESARAGGA